MISQLITPSLSSLRDEDNNGSNIQYVKHCLQSRSWIFVKNDVLKQEDVTNMFNMFDTFCHMPSAFKNGFAKQKLAPSRFGYFATHITEGYRFATGIYTQFFKEYVTSFTDIPKELDSLFRGILTKNGKFVFDINARTSLEHIPMYRNDYAKAGFGLFEIDRHAALAQVVQLGKNELIQVEQSEGLLSVNLGSTTNGLQLLDYATGNWVTVPSGTCVMWCGKEAERISKGAMRAAKFRVIPADQPRISALYEVCVESQMPKELIKSPALPPPISRPAPHPCYSVPPPPFASMPPFIGG